MRASLATILLLLAAASALAAPALAARPGVPAPAAANAPTVVATAAKTEVSVGERFVVDVRASGPVGTSFTFPEDAVQETFELHTAPADKTPLPPGTHRYLAAVFVLGDTSLPAFPVRYRSADGSTGEVETRPIPLHVVSLLPKDKAEQKLADVRGPVALAIGRAFWIALVAALALVGGGVWWLIARRRRGVAVVAAPVPVPPADAEARGALDALVASGRLSRGEYRPFYITLTLIAKRYLERRLEAPIVEMTTAEMLSHLKSTPVAADLTATLRDLAGAADQIKFARGQGLTEAAERHLSATRAMVETVEARLRPVAPAAEPAASPAPGRAA